VCEKNTSRRWSLGFLVVTPLCQSQSFREDATELARGTPTATKWPMARRFSAVSYKQFVWYNCWQRRAGAVLRLRSRTLGVYRPECVAVRMHLSTMFSAGRQRDMKQVALPALFLEKCASDDSKKVSSLVFSLEPHSLPPWRQTEYRAKEASATCQCLMSSSKNWLSDFLLWGWVLLERTRRFLNGIQFTQRFIEFIFVQPNIRR